MESRPSKPTKKRRRWLIATFLLGCVSLISWWCWPRDEVDRRLVGDWVLQSGYVHDYQAIRILDDGTFETYALPSDLLTGLRDQKLSCYTRGGCFSIRPPSSRPNNVNELWQKIKAAIAGERHPSDTHYQIMEIDPASFRIRNNDTFLPFRRVAAAN
ncbi:hypothetical protein AYO47_09645 [Planctomyces sp. SCGC AG-212-M04]|nr:hypothetical protein AYO47_09645 [Planctomyces sp. SCGC AG-212-M04]